MHSIDDSQEWGERGGDRGVGGGGSGCEGVRRVEWGTYLALRDSMNPVPAQSTALRCVKVSKESFPW